MNFWDEKFNKKEFIYGLEPNEFLKTKLSKFDQSSKILFPCEGEGRNSVFAAKLGFNVFAFDSSIIGKQKALNLAKQENVEVNYQLDDANNIEYPENDFDIIASIYAHFPIDVRKSIHHKFIQWLKPGGIIIIEAFNPKQINLDSGGPKKLEMLYDTELLKNDFVSMEIQTLEETEAILNEGLLHKGKAELIRFVAKKL